MEHKKEKLQIPKDGLAGLKENFTTDALSGFLVFLLALPLSLGIAKASDFPAIYGLVTAIVGGIIVSFFAGSLLTIKGPAAGLIVIVSGAVAAMGGGDTTVGWHLALGAIVVAGAIQVLFGLLKLGRLSDFFPGAAIHGMLAAIGIIIISKQVHNLLGIDPAQLKGKAPLELLAMIPESIAHENSHLTEIGIACLAILILFSVVKNKHIKKIPAPLIVLLVAVPLGFVLQIKTEGAIEKFALVKVGDIMDKMKEQFINVDFSGITSHPGEFFEYVILFSLIGSLESLLTVKAIDGLDPFKRKSNTNKDLIAIGAGNMLSGVLGGLPMISEVARSSANVGNGAKTRWANFFHGIFLLIAVLFAVPLIEMIPNTALAAMLIFVGFRLAHPREFMHMLHIGKDQFAVFVVTIIVTLSTDLLIGIGSGILLEMLIYLFNGVSISELFKSHLIVNQIDGQTYEIKLEKTAMFSNLIDLKKQLTAIPEKTTILLDVSNAKLIDHTTISTLYLIKEDFELEGGTFVITGLDKLKASSSHAMASRKGN